MSSFLKTMRMPWMFNAFQPTTAKPLNPLLQKDLLPMSDGFIELYRDLVKAIVNNNLQFLQKVTAPYLFGALKKSFNLVQSNKGRMRVLYSDAKVLTEFYNPKIYTNANFLYKSDYIDPVRPLQYFPYPSAKMRVDKEDFIRFNSSSQRGTVFKVDVVFHSKMHLVLEDEHRKDAQGSRSSQISECHMLTLETQKVCWDRFSSYNDNLKVLLYNFGLRSTWIADYDWRITDLDNFSNRNNPMGV
mmetsp:Transcript_12199/g.23138  ORF Transcript_12199/g.23138 Transcript_12199/m.23138 type:complete len:244 (+) Transcript_12199:116-847(+)